MRNKWLVLTLAGSLVINLVFVGFVVGRMSGGSMPPPSFDQTASLPRLLRFMTEDRRREVMIDAPSHRRELRPTVRALRKAQKRIYGSIDTDPFEADSLRKALADFRGNLDESQVKIHQAFEKVIARLTPQERRALGQVMRNQRKQRPSSPRHPNRTRRPPPPLR